MKFGNKKGVTLIELVIVFIIIGIAAALMAPSIGAWLPRYRLRSAARDIVSTMRSAQMKAVSSNSQYRVNLNSGEVGSNSYILERDTGGGYFADGAVQTLPSGITISNNTLPDQHAVFNPNSTCSSGSVTLRNSKNFQKTISLTSATGRVKLE